MIAAIKSARVLGVTGSPVTVEVHHAAQALPGFTVVGVNDARCRETRDRVRAAMINAGLTWPLGRVTVSVAPAGTPMSASLDLAVAVGVLAATGLVPLEAATEATFIGELGLDGSIRPVAGVVPMVAATEGLTWVPSGSAPDVEHTRAGVLGVRSLGELVTELSRPIDPAAGRALEVAAAGGHHLLLTGTDDNAAMFAAAGLVSMLPDLTPAEVAEVAAIRSAAGVPVSGCRPPLRCPAPSVSTVSLVGGAGPAVRPGEVSLAHAGVLLLDAIEEFAPASLDALRGPLNDGVVRVARGAMSATMPARFQLVARMSPCACGVPGDGCQCTPAARARFTRRISGPLLDRFDLRVPLDAVDAANNIDAARSAVRVAAARARAAARGVRCNADLTAKEGFCHVDDGAGEVLAEALEAGRLSPRGALRVRAVALTLADLDGSATIGPATMAEALELHATPAAVNA